MRLVDINELKARLKKGVYHQNMVNGEMVFTVNDIVLASNKCRNQIVLGEGFEAKEADDGARNNE